MKGRKPNLFIIGAAKSGTTSLYSILATHPDIFMCPIKEPHHFSKDIDPKLFRDEYKKANDFNVKTYLDNTPLPEKHIAFIKNSDFYFDLFREAETQKYIGEASPSYLYSNVAAKEIYSYNPEAKILIILRDPLERVISHYQMDIVSGRQNEKNILKGVLHDYQTKNKGWGITNLYIELSQYKKQVNRYLDLFEPYNVLILNFNDLKNDGNGLIKKITRFLGVSESFNTNIKNANKTQMPKNQLMLYLWKKWKKIKFFKTPVFLKNIIYNNLFEKPKIQIDDVFYDKITDILKEDVLFYESLFNKNPEQLK